jgi:ABC-type lipoprotein release transport system permease subunit
MPPQQHHLFQVNRHVQASIMLLSVMDGADLELNNTILSSTSKTTTTTTTATPSISTSDDYEQGFSSKMKYISFNLFKYV